MKRVLLFLIFLALPALAHAQNPVQIDTSGGAGATIGVTTGSAVTGDSNGTMQGYLRGLSKMFNDIWDSVNHRFAVAVGGNVTVVQATGTNLHMVCDSGCSSAAGFGDNNAFTFGTTVINPIGAVFDDVSSNTATENSAAVLRMTQNKALHINFRNASGTEIGTASNPIQVSLANTAANSTALKVDNSAVTQPTNLTQVGGASITLGQKTMVNSLPVALPSDQFAPDTSGTLQNAAVANGNGSTLSTAGLSSAVLTLNCASCAGGTTVNFEGSEDATNYTALNAHQIGTNTIATSTTTAGVTVWQIPVGGFQVVRARVSSYSAGTVTVTGHAVGGDFNPKTLNANLLAGTQIIGKVGIDQTTPGTTDSVTVATGQGAGATIGTTSDAASSGAATMNAHLRFIAATGIPVTSVPSDPFGANADAASATGSISAKLRQIAANGVAPIAATAGGCTPYSYLAAASANQDSQNITTAASQLYALVVESTTATPRFVKVYDKATGPTSADTPKFRTIVPTNSTNGAGYVVNIPVGAVFANGIAFRITANIADNDANAVTANDVIVNACYK